MKNNKLMAFAAAALLLAACAPRQTASSTPDQSPTESEPSNSNTDSKTPEVDTSGVKLLTPVGIPTLAFYDQGENTNWTSTGDPSNVIAPAWGNDNYDAIVFDGINGLNVAKKKGDKYVLARWISGGTFYVVSTKHDSVEDMTKDSLIYGFNETGVGSQVFRSLAASEWDIDQFNAITYAGGVAQVLSALTNTPETYDFYILSQPQLLNAQTALGNKGIELNIISDLQADWAEAHDGCFVPAAALFVNKKAYSEKKDVMDAFLAEVDERIETAVDNPQTAVDALTDYASKHDDAQTRFGYAPSLVASLQADGKNGFNLQKDGEIDPLKTTNEFQTAIGGAAFDATSFLN